MNNTNSKWSEVTKKSALDLHDQLKIKDDKWHGFKSDPDRRVAELLSGAILQLLNDGEYSDVVSILEQSILWLNREVKDPGCPRH